jgi:hypothetical protein
MTSGGCDLLTIGTSSSSSLSSILRLRCSGVKLAFWFSFLSSWLLGSISGLVNLTNPSRLDCPELCGSLGGVDVFGVVLDGVGMLKVLIR